MKQEETRKSSCEVDKEILQQEAELAVTQYRMECRHNLYGSFTSSE